MFYAVELLVNDNFDITSSVINLVRYSRSRSFKVIEIGTNRKSVRDFLFVIHCNCAYLLSFTIYNDMLVENAFFRRFTHRSLVQSPLWGSLCSRVQHAVSKTGVHRWLVKWLSGRTLVFDRRVFAVLRSTYS